MNQERVFKVLLGPHITEKAAMSAAQQPRLYLRLLLTPANWK